MEKRSKIKRIISTLLIVTSAILFLVGIFFLTDAVWGYFSIGKYGVDKAACWTTAAILFGIALLVLIIQGLFFSEKDNKKK